SAERERDLSAGWRKLPAFLAELRPAMAALGDTADTQGPALRTLAANAGQLQRFFDDLAPLSDASRPAFRALGQASTTGRQAVTAATPTVHRLNRFASGTPELGTNLAMVLEHLDDRANTIEYDKRAAVQQGVKEPSGYSGLEALLQYVFDQATSINVYDQASHVLTVQAFNEDNCVDYRDGELLNKDPNKAAILKECQAKLGPSAPGVETPDPTAGDAPARKLDYALPTGGPAPGARRRALLPSYQDLLNQNRPQPDTQTKPDAPAQDKPPGGGNTPGVPTPPGVPPVPQPQVPPVPPLPGSLPLPDPGKGLPGGTSSRGDGGPLLNYLLGS